MALQLIYGSAASKRTEYMFRNICEQAQKNPDLHYLFIVPEQSTLLIQRELVRLHPCHALNNIDVLSFARLAYRIFDEMRTPPVRLLNDTGKSMILRRVAERCSKEMNVFAGNLKKTGFIAELKSVISEFSQYGIREEDLLLTKDKLEQKPLLQQKISDLATLYSAFRRELSDDYITAEELLSALCRELVKSQMIQQSVVILEGFTGFTPLQYQVLELLMQRAKHLVCAVTLGEGEDPYCESEEYELFHMSHVIVKRLSAIAKAAGVPYGEAYNRRISEETMRPVAFYADAPDAVNLVKAQTPEEEIRFVYRRVQELVREKGYHYREIAVITGDLSAYAIPADEILGKAGIPYFIDQKKNLQNHPLVELIRSILDVLEDDFTYESVIPFLRNGLVSCTKNQVDVFDNYVAALGIRGFKRYEEKWEGEVYRIHEEQRETVNELRSQMVEWFTPLRLSWKKTDVTVRELVTQLYHLLTALQVERKLKDMADAFAAEQKFNLEKEYRQAYARIMELFDQMVDLMGEEKPTPAVFRDILDSGFEETAVGLVPPTIDRMVVGDVMRTRLGNIRALFIVGVNDRVLPKVSEHGGVISDYDREVMKDLGLVLAPTAREDAFTQQYYIHLALTKPSDYLCLSYSTLDASGKSQRPSHLIEQLMMGSPKRCVLDAETIYQGIDAVIAPEDGFALLTRKMRELLDGEPSDQWQELYAWYAKNPEWKQRLDHLKAGLFYSYGTKQIDRQVARRLFGDVPLNSVTRLERYAACAYAHFLAYGLNLKPKVRYQLNAADYGTIFHAAIELVFKRMTQEDIAFSDLTEEQRAKMVRESVYHVAEEYGNTILQSSSRNKYLVERMTRLTDRTIWALKKQWEYGDYQKAVHEVSFVGDSFASALRLPVSKELAIKLQGRIDRMDIVVAGEEVYVKIIDYKSGSTTFDLTKLQHGLQLQLMLYLEAAIEMAGQQYPDKKVVPAGVYYYHIKDPVVEVSGDSSEEIEAAILKELRMDGLSNRSAMAMQLLDHAAGKSSVVVKGLSRGEDGMATKQSIAASTARIKKLCGEAREKATALSREMLEGHVEVNPYEYKHTNPCTYCDYHAVCGFDTRTPGCHYRRLSVTDAKEVLGGDEE